MRDLDFGKMGVVLGDWEDEMMEIIVKNGGPREEDSLMIKVLGLCAL